MPSSEKAYRAMIKLTEGTGDGPIYDLGSGWGSLVIRMASKFPNRLVVGYELSLLPYLVSLLVKRLMRLENLNLYRQDFMKADLSGASVLLCYLYPAGMSKLDLLIDAQSKKELNASTSSHSKSNAKQLSNDTPYLPSGCKPKFVISNNFALPSRKAEKEIRLNDLYRSPIFRYRLDLTINQID